MNQLPHDLKPAPRHWWFAAGLLVLVTAAVYWPVATHEFINYDDPLYVTENGHVNAGLTRGGIVWAFTRIAGERTYWHPLTWLSHMLDCQLFGLNAGAHHLVNLLFHLANVVLLLALFHRMTGSVWRSGVVAGLFALHPLQVDTVAWVAERKNVLSTLLGLLTLLAYTRYAQRPRVGRYCWVVVLFALGLMAKPSLVTLPCVLLLLDYWPLGRLAPRGLRLSKANPLPQFPVGRLLREKVPLFVLSGLSSAITVLAHERLNMVMSAEQFSLWARLANAVVSYVRYLGKWVWPSHLAVYYPYSSSLRFGEIGLAVLVLSAVSVLALWQARRRPYLLVGWLWFLGTLVPMIGLVQVGTQGVADRFAYVPIIGLFIMLTWGMAGLVPPWRHALPVLVCSAGAVLAACAAATWFQLQHWKNSETLFRHAIQVTSDAALSHNNLGHALFQQGKHEEAIVHLGEAARLDPGNAKVHNNLGNALVQLGQLSAAVEQYEQVLRLSPENVTAHHKLGNALVQLGRVPEAIGHLEEAVRLDPDSAHAHHNLANALFQLDQVPEAIRHLEQALRLMPEFVEAHYNLGNLLLLQGRMEEAVAQFLEALRINPRNAEAHYYLAGALARQKKMSEAATHLYAALKIKPGDAAAANDLAWLLATEKDETLRNVQEAVRWARRACDLTTNRVAIYLDTLGVACSEAGQFAEAVQATEQAVACALAAGDTAVAARIQGRLEPFRCGRPYHAIAEDAGP